ncbi:glycosyltransferase family 4 protein, partial [Odoribacter sp. OttesenSCG-928-J03]|nr:glycosyltransferase family 4 protein [Odoribacter sp. OttesenSCG-928-J03]
MEKLFFIRYKKSKDILEGGEQASQKNHNILSEILGRDNVYTYYIHDESRRKNVTDYIGAFFHFLQNYFFGLSPRRVNEIIDLAKQYDYIFIDRSVFGIIAKKLKASGYPGMIISFFHNVEVEYFKVKTPRFAFYRPLVLRCADVNDRYTCLYSDRIIALNMRDSKELKRRYNREADALIPIAMKDVYKRDTYSLALTRRQPICFFLGAYFSANNEGIKWFIKEVYPFVDIKLMIVGKGMEQLKKEITIPKGVEIINSAPELLPFFEEADMLILPIFRGSGMKVKTCESLMYGKNILGTTEAFEGYDVNYEKVGALCNTKEEFIERISDFITNPRPRFNSYSRNLFL